MFLPQIMDGDQPHRDDQGRPVQRFMFLPARQATILDTWHTLGMRGTGSHDVVVADLFIPERHTAPLVPLAQPGTAYQGPLYRLTLWVPVRRAFSQRLCTAGKAKKGALTACMRKLLTILNALVKPQTPWQGQEVPSA